MENMFHNWLATDQQQQGSANNHHVHHQHDQHSPPSIDDWSAPTAPKDRAVNPIATVGTSSGGVGGPSSPTVPSNTSASLDLSDFGLEDIPGVSNASSMMQSPTAFYSPYNYFNAVPYYSNWSQASLPLSNYSTLNGATNPAGGQPQASHHQQTGQQPQTQSTDPHAQPQHTQAQSPPQQPQGQSQSAQQQHAGSPQQMSIDPALTMSMHPSSSNGMQYPGSFQQSHSSLQPHAPYGYPPQVQSYNSNYYRAQTSQQGTLSPQVLHQTSGISPTMFYGHHVAPPPPPSADASSAQATAHQLQQQHQQQIAQYQQQQEQLKKEQEDKDKKEAMQKSIRGMLTTFSGAAAVGRLVALIDDYGMAEVEPHLRIELLTRMRDNAGNHYFRAWAENDLAIEVTREWLKAAAKGDRTELADTIMPLLHIIDRLPFTLESLSASKLGKVVRYINSKENSFPPAIKDMASNLEKRWRQMLASAPETKGTLESADDGKSKKRKLGEGSRSTGNAPSGGAAGGPPAKKPAFGTASSAKPMVAKKEAPSSKTATLGPAAVAAAAKDTKTDMSFFSAPKTKKALPSFKKAPVAAQTFKKEENVAQPSAVDPFQELLKSMNKPKKELPVIRTPPAATHTPPGGVETASGVPGIGKNGKPKKSVTWAPEGKLEAIRLIEPAVYDDDPAHGTRMTNFRDLDKGEGAALHTTIFEEILDWFEPQALELDDVNDRPRGENSQEASTQAEREQTALSALYMSTAQIPDSPAEPSTAALSEEEVDQNVAQMTVGEENDHVFWGEEMEYAAQQQSSAAQQQSSAAQQQSSAAQQQSSAAAVAAAIAAGFPNPAGSANPVGNVALLIQQLAQGVNPLGAVLSNDMQQQQQHSSVAALPNSDQLAQLLNQLAGAGAGSGTTMQPQYGQASYGDDQSNPAGGWTATSNQFSADYGQGYDDPDPSRGWDGGRGGGRGRGRGRGGRGGGGSGFRIKRKPCIFFAEGRCRNGDQCDFLHETGYTYS